MADENLINQDDIEHLLGQQKPPGPPPTGPASGGQPEKQASAGEPPAPSPEAAKAARPPIQGGGKKAVTAAGKAALPPKPAPADEGDDKVLGQHDIERLLSEAGRTPAPQPAAPPVAKETPPGMAAGEGEIATGDMEYLLNQAEQALASIDAHSAGDVPHGITSFRLPELSGTPASQDAATLDLIRDVELDLKIELGRTHMYLEDVLKLRKGSVVPLDKLAGDPVDIFVNGRLIARGEVLVLNDNFCVRVAELIAGTNVSA
jgi:flagellar motor switch protein FliN/FliY